MNKLSPAQMLKEWDLEVNQVPLETSTLPHRFELQSLRLLADGEPVTPEMIGLKLGIPAQLAYKVFEASAGKGEWNEDGHLIGSALTLVPTQHRFNVMDKDLYTWCAHDTILLPGLLGMVAKVASPDPSDGELIRLVMGPDGPQNYSPESAVLSIFQAAAPATGPTSPVCTNSHFFTSAESAESWSNDRDGVMITEIEEAFSQIKQSLLDPLQPILDELDSN